MGWRESLGLDQPALSWRGKLGLTDDEEWEDLGIFERNRLTGEKRLKSRPGLPTAEMAAEEPSVLGEFGANISQTGRQIASPGFLGSIGKGVALNAAESLAPIQAVRGAQRLGILDRAPESPLARLEASYEASREGLPFGVKALGTAAEIALDPMNLAAGAGLASLAKPRAVESMVSPGIRELAERSLRIAPEINESLLAERRVNAPLRDAVERLLPDVRKSTNLKALAETAEREGDEALMRAVERVAIERPSGTAPFNVISKALKSDLPAATPRAPLKPPETPFQYNLSRLDIPQDVADDVVNVIADNLDDIQKHRREIQSLGKFDESGIKGIAQKLGKTVEDYLATKPGQTFNDDELALLDSTLGNVARRMKSLADEVSAGGDSLANKAELSALRDQYVGLLKVSIGAGTEAGRSLNSLKAFKKALGEPERIRLEVMKTYASRMSDKAIQGLAKIDPTNPDELAKYLRSITKPKMGDYAYEVFINSIVSGPGSHGRNMIGNALFQTLEVPVYAMRAIADIPISKMQGRPREFYLSEIVPGLTGWIRGLPAGVAKGLQIMKRGVFDDIHKLGAELPRESFAQADNAGVRALSPVVNAPVRALAAEDAVFKSMAFQRGMHMRATRMAIQEGHRGDALAKRVGDILEDPPEKLLAKARNDSLVDTFNDPASPAAQAFLALRGKIPGARYITPFVKIADRLLVRGAEFTPYGFAKALQKANRSSPEASDLVSRAAFGSAVMTGLAAYAADGKITAWAPRDPAERAAFYEQGKQPWSVKVGESWYPFRQLEPIATPMMMVAAGMQTYKEKGELPAEQQIISMAGAVGQSLLDKTYLTGVADLFEAVERGQISPESSLTAGIRQIGALAVPYSGLQRGIATAMSPEVVQPRTTGEAILQNVPGARESVPKRLDPFGETITPATGRLRGFLPTGTPFVPSKESSDPLTKELRDLGVVVGFVGSSLTINRGEGSVKLSTDERREHQRLVGGKIKDALSRLIGSASYQMASKEQRKKAVETTIRRVRDDTAEETRRKLREQRRAILP